MLRDVDALIDAAHDERIKEYEAGCIQALKSELARIAQIRLELEDAERHYNGIVSQIRDKTFNPRHYEARRAVVK